jgi:hypothetical protein
MVRIHPRSPHILLILQEFLAHCSQNAPLPVSGTVTVENLPLDANGNVLVDVARDMTQYQFQSIVALQCVTTNGCDFCTGSENTPIEQMLPTLSSRGYELVSVVPISAGIGSINAAMSYTLTAPLSGAHRRRSSVPGPTLKPQSRVEASILWERVASAHCA